MVENQKKTTEEKIVEGVDMAPGSEQQSTQDRAEQSADQVENVSENASAADGNTVDQVNEMNDNGNEFASEAGEEDELSKAKREIAELKDSWTRERAEFQNFRKRTGQEYNRIRIQSVTNFLGGLLPVIDNMERVLAADVQDPAVKNFVTGVEMIYQEFLGVLHNEGVEQFNPEGQAFDPYSMEAIASEERPDIKTEQVLEVFQKGFIIKREGEEDQIIRVARVKVGQPAKKSDSGSENSEGEGERTG